MPQSLAKVYTHIVFTTRHGQCFITDEVRAELHSYIIGTISAMGMFTCEVYANPDHVHILTTLSRTIIVADTVSKIKTSSSKWLKTKGISGFDWQDGYGIFSVSASGVDAVSRYIRNQTKHHVNTGYKDELRLFFRKYKIEYDERYVWD